MCDYSLEMQLSRPATVGDKLTVHRFNTATTGFIATSDTDDRKTAVCLLPGTELAFDAAVTKASIGDYGYTGDAHTYEHAVAVFTQIIRPKMIDGRYHKDGLEFPDGKKVLLNDIVPGQTATVLQMPAEGIEKLPGQAVMDHIQLPADCEPVATAQPAIA